MYNGETDARYLREKKKSDLGVVEGLDFKESGLLSKKSALRKQLKQRKENDFGSFSGDSLLYPASSSQNIKRRERKKAIKEGKGAK